MASYLHGTATVTTTRSVLVTTGASGGVLVQNNGSVAVFLGGSTVTADATATGGISVAAGASVTVPTVGGAKADLYAIVASSTAAVAWLSPA
jgi:hypothetical protein